MTPSLRRRAIRRALAGLAAGTLLLTACNDDFGEFTYNTDYRSFGDPDQLLAGAVDNTLGLQSFSADSTLTWSSRRATITLSTTGAFDYEDMVGEVELTAEEDGARRVIEMRSDGSTAWIKPAGEEAFELPAGLEWVEGDASRLADNPTFAVKPVGVLSPVILLKASEGAEKTGTENDLMGFRTTVDYQKAVAAAGPLGADLRRGFHPTASVPLMMHIDAWIDDDGVVRKMELTYQLEDVFGGYSMTLEAVDEPVVAPEPPAASTVFSGPEAEALFDQMVG